LLETVENFPLEELRRYRRFPWGPEDLTGLKQSIATKGQQSALVVARTVPGPRKEAPSTHMVVADGMRRLDAMQQLGMTTAKVIIGDTFTEILNLLPARPDDQDEFQVSWMVRQLHLGALYYRVLSPIGAMEQRRTRSMARPTMTKQRGGSPKLGAFRLVAYEHLDVSETSMNAFRFLESVLEVSPRPRILEEAMVDLDAGLVNMDGVASRIRKSGIYSDEIPVDYASGDELNRILRSIDGLTPSLVKVTASNIDRLNKEEIQGFLDGLGNLKTVLFRVTRILEKGL
jgi:ParB-like nuclease family protein